MKKFMTFLLGILICILMAGCSNQVVNKEEVEADFDITVDFSFYKDGNKKNPFEGSEFEINTRIFVCVDFTITKNVEAEEIISFVVQIPYAEYYSTKDYYEGTIKPHENPYIQQDSYGNEYTVMELNQMNFIINDNETKFSKYNQTNNQILNYVKKEYQKIYSSNIFSIYIN